MRLPTAVTSASANRAPKRNGGRRDTCEASIATKTLRTVCFGKPLSSSSWNSQVSMVLLFPNQRLHCAAPLHPGSILPKKPHPPRSPPHRSHGTDDAKHRPGRGRIDDEYDDSRMSLFLPTFYVPSRQSESNATFRSDISVAAPFLQFSPSCCVLIGIIQRRGFEPHDIIHNDDDGKNLSTRVHRFANFCEHITSLST